VNLRALGSSTVLPHCLEHCSPHTHLHTQVLPSSNWSIAPDAPNNIPTIQHRERTSFVLSTVHLTLKRILAALKRGTIAQTLQGVGACRTVEGALQKNCQSIVLGPMETGMKDCHCNHGRHFVQNDRYCRECNECVNHERFCKGCKQCARHWPRVAYQKRGIINVCPVCLNVGIYLWVEHPHRRRYTHLENVVVRDSGFLPRDRLIFLPRDR